MYIDAKSLIFGQGQALDIPIHTHPLLPQVYFPSTLAISLHMQFCRRGIPQLPQTSIVPMLQLGFPQVKPSQLQLLIDCFHISKPTRNWKTDARAGSIIHKYCDAALQDHWFYNGSQFPSQSNLSFNLIWCIPPVTTVMPAKLSSWQCTHGVVSFL